MPSTAAAMKIGVDMFFILVSPSYGAVSPRRSIGLFRERRELGAAERRAGEAPTAFRRFGEEHPRARGLRGIAGDLCDDLGHLRDEALLARPVQGAGRREYLDAYGARRGGLRRMDRRRW